MLGSGSRVVAGITILIALSGDGSDQGGKPEHTDESEGAHDCDEELVVSWTAEVAIVLCSRR
jgi:hypothetical protein